MKSFLKIRIIAILTIGCIAILQSCKEKPTIPVLTTVNVSGIATTSAMSGGNITDDGGAEVTAYGVCWGTAQNPTISSSKTNDGTGIGAFTSSITGLTANTNYHVRAYATNSEGTSYGNEVSFTTNPVSVATITTASVTSVTHTTAVSGGNISDNGGSAVSSSGICWSTSQNPTTADTKTTDGSGTGSFTSNLTGLEAGITYYLRAYATNSAGTVYGNQQSFTTISLIGFNPLATYGNVTDIEGNVYKTIKIGTQTWMAENLKTTIYNNNSPIPLVTNSSTWSGLSTHAYCWYNNDINNKKIYGALYNWYTVNNGNLCPTGWHIPTDSECTTLLTYLGSAAEASAKLRETGTDHWLNPNNDATNGSGFTALPAGDRWVGQGEFEDMGNVGSFWCATTGGGKVLYVTNLSDPCGFQVLSSLKTGISVRCVKD